MDGGMTLNCAPTADTEQAIIDAALKILQHRMAYHEYKVNSPADVKNYLTLKMAHLEHEEFWCIWLDARNHVIESESLFRGTLMQASVFPREVVKRALHHNAAAVIFAHNHPSGVPEPSSADQTLTEALKRALRLIDMRVLDHVIVAGTNTMSFAEKGLL